MENKDFDCNDYVEVAEGIFWVGFADMDAGFHCNPYLIVDNEEAALIDSGSRNDFSTVMLKIMRTGTNPKNISRLIYQHYDPDLCGNIPHMEAMIDNKELKLISHKYNNIFINYYSTKSPKECVEEMGFHYEFSSGRRLHFIHTPYCHAPGSFMTYDTKTKVLFSSDIFGSYDSHWELYAQFSDECLQCQSLSDCPITGRKCHMIGIIDFHKHIMPSAKALRHALGLIKDLDISLIAPQHGSVLSDAKSQNAVIEKLMSLSSIGIDNYLKESGI